MTDNSRPLIVITGANGFLGSTLVQYFSSKNWNVTALVRHPDKFADTENVSYLHYDLSQSVNDGIFKNADYLVHTAYVKQDYEHPNAHEVNLTAAKNLLAASREHSLKKNVFISSMSAHENAISVYGRQKFAIEKLFNSQRDVSLRPGLIIGNGGIVKNMVNFMRSKHLVPLIGGGKQLLQTIEINDLARAIDQTLVHDQSGVLTVAHPQTYTYRQFYQTIGKALNIRIVFVPVPANALLALLKILAAMRINLSINEDNVRGLQKLQAVDTKADLTKLGIQPLDLPQSLSHSKLEA
jgi:nucleoside-diphosphate-sugar epimerase